MEEKEEGKMTMKIMMGEILKLSKIVSELDEKLKSTDKSIKIEVSFL